MLLLFSLCGHGQAYSENLKPAELKLPDKKVKGYSTSMDFSEDDIYYGWWKYAKQFSRPRNQRTHYEVTIPATKDSKEVMIYAQVDQGPADVLLMKLGMEMSGMGEEEKKRFDKQLKDMLIDFKRWFYLRHFQEELVELESNEPGSKDWSKWMTFARKRQQIIERMKQI